MHSSLRNVEQNETKAIEKLTLPLKLEFSGHSFMDYCIQCNTGTLLYFMEISFVKQLLILRL